MGSRGFSDEALGTKSPLSNATRRAHARECLSTPNSIARSARKERLEQERLDCNPYLPSALQRRRRSSVPCNPIRARQFRQSRRIDDQHPQSSVERGNDRATSRGIKHGTLTDAGLAVFRGTRGLHRRVLMALAAPLATRRCCLIHAGQARGRLPDRTVVRTEQQSRDRQMDENLMHGG